ncbi:PIG-L family deacetylase [Roseofilum casamattae]|uniref:PIG-L family deacetylase n=1 Tax=Roseofilum casamattae BLCC-M143 TaxID=3022442 RepID=A0ABT7BU31_9CYAN|nr:PIG-L family deacetylase [Roseofilum casamattae]MDJ1182697.1 PIG-L family deacetylase [Roseofilum casamattae BLCC-M143]
MILASEPVSRLMVVAHPDDEILFGGQELIQRSEWLVICLTNGNNDKRKQQFFQVMNYLSIPAEIWDYPDRPGLSKDKNLAENLWLPLLPEIQSRLSSILSAGDFQQVVTHNYWGEYGHKHHQLTHKLVKEIVPADKLFCFGLGSEIAPEILEKKLTLLDFYEEQFTPREQQKYWSWITRSTIKSLVSDFIELEPQP